MFLFFSGDGCCDKVTLGTMPNDLDSPVPSGTYTLNPDIEPVYDKNVYKNGAWCIYWYGPRKRWQFNYCSKAASDGALR